MIFDSDDDTASIQADASRSSSCWSQFTIDD
jgi:hypothetical protein